MARSLVRIQHGTHFSVSKILSYFDSTVCQKQIFSFKTLPLPLVLNRDLKHENVSLETSGDLQELRNLAQDRGEWSALTSRVIEAGEAEESDDNSAGRPN